MKESKQRIFVKGSLIITVSNILLKGVTFLLLPLYTRYLTPEMLGVSDSVTTFTAFVFPILVLGLDSAFGAFYYDRDSREYRMKIFNTIEYALIFTGMLSLLLLIFAKTISQVLFGTGDYQILILLAVCSMICNLFYLPYALYVRMENRMMLFAAVNVLTSVFHIILNIFCLCVFKMGVYSLIVSMFVTHFMQAALYGVLVKVEFKKRYFDVSLLKRMLKYSLPLLPVVVVSWVLQVSDRYILLKLCGEGEVGIYGIGARFSNLVSLLANGVYTAYTSYAFGKKDDLDAKAQYARILDDFVYAGLICCSVLTVFSFSIIRLMTTQSYGSAVQLMAPLVFSQLYNGINTLVGYGIGFAKKTYYFLIATSIGAVINVITNLIFIPKYGALAASYTTLGSILIMAMVTYLVSQRLYKINYNVMKAFLCPLTVYMIEVFFQKENVFLQIVEFTAIAVGISLLFRSSFFDYFNTMKNMLYHPKRKE